MGTRPTTQLPRKRQLNVVYFVDSSRTRSFRIPLRRLNFLLFLFFGVLTWSLVSIGVIGYMLKDRLDASARLRDSLAVIFDYETRYDRVYEKAYPADGRLVTPIAEESGDEADGDQPEQQLVSVNNADAAATTAAKPDAKVEDTDSEEFVAETPATPKASAAADEITVAEPVVTQTGDAIEITFTIKNENSHDRVEGFIWAVADFRDKDGKTVHIGSPSAIDVDAKGEVKHKERSHRFSIRHYKRKQFHFPLPKNPQGTVTAIHIGVQYRSGKENFFDVPVEINFGSSDTTPETDKKPG